MPLTTVVVLHRLREAVEAAGGVRAYARKTRVSAAYVSDVLGGRRSPGVKILKPLGLTKRTRRVVNYEFESSIDGEG